MRASYVEVFYALFVSVYISKALHRRIIFVATANSYGLLCLKSKLRMLGLPIRL